jgi:hypothetical protein
MQEDVPGISSTQAQRTCSMGIESIEITIRWTKRSDLSLTELEVWSFDPSLLSICQTFPSILPHRPHGTFCEQLTDLPSISMTIFNGIESLHFHDTGIATKNS